MKKELLEAALLYIKKLAEETPNDMELGKVIRNYIREQEELNSDEDTYDEGLK